MMSRMVGKVVKVRKPNGFTTKEFDKLLYTLNGLSIDCQGGGFQEGSRNEIILDIVVCSELLGLNALDTITDFLTTVIDPEKDDENTYDRAKRMLNYRGRFSYDYMLSPNYYYTVGLERETHGYDMKLKFVFDNQ